MLIGHPVALMLREPPCRATLREIVRTAGHRLVLLLQIVVGMVLAAVADSLLGSVARWLALKHLAVAEQAAVRLSRTYSTEHR